MSVLKYRFDVFFIILVFSVRVNCVIRNFFLVFVGNVFEY